MNRYKTNREIYRSGHHHMELITKNYITVFADNLYFVYFTNSCI